jgi:hypothetical protein
MSARYVGSVRSCLPSHMSDPCRWWRPEGLVIDQFIHAAPADWQILQLALGASHQTWQLYLDRAPIEAHPAKMLARWHGNPGLAAYAVRASVAKFMTRAFYLKHQHGGTDTAPRWDVLHFLASQGSNKVDLTRFSVEVCVGGSASSIGSSVSVFNLCLADMCLADTCRSAQTPAS